MLYVLCHLFFQYLSLFYIVGNSFNLMLFPCFMVRLEIKFLVSCTLYLVKQITHPPIPSPTHTLTHLHPYHTLLKHTCRPKSDLHITL